MTTPRSSQARVDAVVAHLVEDAVAHGNAFQGVILALEGDEQVIGGGKGVEGQNAQGGRTVNQDKIEAGRDRDDGLQQARQAVEMVFGAGDLNFRAAHIHLAGDDLQALEGGGADFFRQVPSPSRGR